MSTFLAHIDVVHLFQLADGATFSPLWGAWGLMVCAVALTLAAAWSAARA